MRELIERLEKAIGPKRSLDGEIAATLKQNPIWAVVQRPRQPELFVDGASGLRQRQWLAPEFTKSLDAAVALAEQVLPGCFYLIAKGKTRATEPLYAAQLLFGSDVISEAEHDASPAIALCIALLKAKEASNDA